MSVELYPFQRQGVSFLEREKRGLLADSPRLGKAVMAMSAAKGKTLILAPAMVLEAGWWREDLERFAPNLDATLVSYSSLTHRYTEWNGKRNVSKTLPIPRRDIREQDWDTLILDESHHIKERGARWTQAALSLTPNVEYCFLLSGTPIPNWAHELFTTLQAIFPGDRRFTSYWRWIREWFSTDRNRFNMKAIEIGGLKRGIKWEDFMLSNLGSHFLRRTWQDAGIQMPPYLHSVTWVNMTPSQASAYKGFKKDFLARVESGGILRDVPVWTSGAQTVKLAQVTTGLETLGIGAAGSGKLDAVREILRNFQGEPIVLFCWYRNTAVALERVATAMGRVAGIVMGQTPNRGETVRKFQSGEIDCLIGTIRTVNESLQMHRANIGVLVERGWRPSWNEQVADRLALIGKTHPVSIIDLVTLNTVDQKMYFELKRKTDEQMAALTAGQFAEML